jgi:hypothetical protein
MKYWSAYLEREDRKHPVPCYYSAFIKIWNVCGYAIPSKNKKNYDELNLIESFYSFYRNSGADSSFDGHHHHQFPVGSDDGKSDPSLYFSLSFFIHLLILFGFGVTCRTFFFFSFYNGAHSSYKCVYSFYGIRLPWGDGRLEANIGSRGGLRYFWWTYNGKVDRVYILHYIYI